MQVNWDVVLTIACVTCGVVAGLRMFLQGGRERRVLLRVTGLSWMTGFPAVYLSEMVARSAARHGLGLVGLCILCVPLFFSRRARVVEGQDKPAV